MYPAVNIERAIDRQVIDSRPSASRRGDYQKVRAFLQLQGHPNRPVDQHVRPRDGTEFEWRLPLLGGREFFDPFNRLLKVLGIPEMQIEPEQEAIDYWNAPKFASRVMTEVCDRLDRGDRPELVPRLVSVFLNLERERVPGPEEWPAIDVIAVPGSRTIDRAAEAFRAYLRTDGRASIVTSGRVPYYDNARDVPILESEANAAYLRLLGVPWERIQEESTSRDTAENVEFLPLALERVQAARNTEVKKILLVTSPFHLARYRFNVESMMRGSGRDVYAIGSKASRYWAETYFLTDSKSTYTREGTIQVVFNEYVKVAFDLCASRVGGVKEAAHRGPGA